MLNEMVLDSWNIGLRLYAHLVLKIGLRDLDNFYHISYLYIENLWHRREN